MSTPLNLVAACAAALAEVERKFGSVVFDQAVIAHTNTDDYYERIGQMEQYKASAVHTLGPDSAAETFPELFGRPMAKVIPFRRGGAA